MGWLWTRHGFTACDSVPLNDRGFRYGMSVFESWRVWRGRPVFFEEHLGRLATACAQVGFTPDPAALQRCRDLLHEDGFTRIYVTAGGGSATDRAADSCVLVFNEPRAPLNAAAYQRGYALGLAEEPHQPIFNGLKTANYWKNLDALRRGQELEKNEILLFNPDGNLISACMANVFCVTKGRLKTPPLGAGARDGVVRAWILQNRAVEQSPVTREEVATADEIFLTSSWLGVMPAVSLDGRRLETTTALALHDAYETAITTESVPE